MLPEAPETSRGGKGEKKSHFFAMSEIFRESRSGEVMLRRMSRKCQGVISISAGLLASVFAYENEVTLRSPFDIERV